LVERSLAESEEHKRLVKMMLNHFKSKGYTNLKADLEGETPPNQIYGHIPDLTCNKNDAKGTFIILEAETCDTIFDEHTEDQWKTFYRKAREVGGEFHIVVPRTCNGESAFDLVEKRLKELGIRADSIWRPKN